MTKLELLSDIEKCNLYITDWKTVDYDKVERFFKHLFFKQPIDREWIQRHLRATYEQLDDDVDEVAPNIVLDHGGTSFYIGRGGSFRYAMDFEQAYNILFDVDIDQVQIINF